MTKARPTIEDLDPHGRWRAFARRYPEAARAINAAARETLAHNVRVAQTLSHGAAGMARRVNHASITRSNIVCGTPEDLWPRIARQWTT